MSFTRRYQGKHVKIDPRNTTALAQCDYSDFTFNHPNLKKQYQWRGDSLQWTGFLVGEPYMDEPNEQLRPPPVKPDPYATQNARLPQPFGPENENSPQLFTQQIIAQLNALYLGPFEASNSPVIPSPQPVSIAVQENIPDGVPVPPTQMVVNALNKYHWGSN